MIHFFEHIPALVRLAFVFAVIIFLIRKNISLGNTFLFSAIIQGILFGLGPTAMIKSFVSAVMGPKTILLAITVALILVLSNAMDRTGRMKDLLNNFQGLIKNPKLNIIVFPSLIGLLPMPGGAVFSAPMVKELGNGGGYSPSRLSFINYWFRHIWEYWWPLYPGILLLTVLSNIPLPKLMYTLFPLTFVALALGYGVLLGRHPEMEIEKEKHRTMIPFLKALIPILMVIIGGLGLGLILTYLFPGLHIAKELGLVFALSASICQVWRSAEMGTRQLLRIACNFKTLNIIYMIFAILIFKGFLEDSRAVVNISRELDILGISLMLITAVIPLIVGIITGLTIAVVGGAFPILIPLIQSLDPGSSLLAYMVLGMICGLVGVLISPVHLCLILSNEFFGTKMGAVYRHLAPRCFVLIIAGYIYFFLLKSL